MARFTQHVDVAAAPQRVFAYLADQTHMVDWHPAIVRASAGADEPEAGATTEAVFVFYTRDIDLAYELTTFDPPRRVVAEARSRRARARDEWTIEATAEGGSRITWESELVLGGLLRVFDRGLQVAFDGIGARAAAGLAAAID